MDTPVAIPTRKERLEPCQLFSDRETIAEALAYADLLIGAMPQSQRAAAYTAMWVVLNTVLKVERS